MEEERKWNCELRLGNEELLQAPNNDDSGKESLDDGWISGPQVIVIDRGRWGDSRNCLERNRTDR